MLRQLGLRLQQPKTGTEDFARASLEILSVPCQTSSPLSQIESEMKELVLDLITSYENSISTVEELITTAYRATASPDEGLAELDRERERLRISLRETLAKDCSLRRKDFNNLMEKILSDSERKRKEIEEGQKQVRGKLKEYVNEQKELAAYLKKQMMEFAENKGDKGKLSVILNEFKTVYQDKGGEVLALLRDFELHLETFRREQDEINRELQRLSDRGESLTIEDLRQLEAAGARQDRKAARELRRQEVERLLTHFKERRQGGSRQ